MNKQNEIEELLKVKQRFLLTELSNFLYEHKELLVVTFSFVSFEESKIKFYITFCKNGYLETFVFEFSVFRNFGVFANDVNTFFKGLLKLRLRKGGFI